MSKRAIERDPVELAPNLAYILSNLPEAEIVVATTIDAGGNANDSEFFCSTDRVRAELPLEEIFYWCLRDEAPRVFVTTKARGPIDVLSEADLEFARALIATGRDLGVAVDDVLLIGMGGDWRLMRESVPELWA